MANEKRLIDANALAKDLELMAKHEDSFRKSVILGVVHTVKAQPTVDAVEVVRCKDCKHREDRLCTLESVYDYPWYYTQDDDFCSYGERKDNE